MTDAPSCRLCKDHRLTIPYDQSKGYWHHYMNASLGDIKSAVEKGCLLCGVILKVVTEYAEINLPNEVKINVVSRSGDRTAITWPSYDQRSICKPVQLELFTPEGYDEPWPIVPSRTPVSCSSGSNTAVQIAKAFIDDCLCQHSLCSADPVSQTRPARFLKVGLTPEVKQCFLIKSEDVSPQVRYVALSYVWGPYIQHNITTQANLQSRYDDGFPLSSLPRTIREAALFSRSLGVEHLWIDSLCIIQDSLEDWGTESAHMASVYASAYLTISADNSLHSDEGLFSSHSLSTHREILVRGPGKGPPLESALPQNDSYIICAMRAENLCQFKVSLDDSDTTNPNVRVFPLMTRGWTLQERVLSPRILHFNDKELSFECRETYRCECQGPGRPKERRDLVSMNLLTPYLSSRLEGREFITPVDLDSLWSKLIQSFTRRRLTNTSDNLPALLGIVNAIYELVRGTQVLSVNQEQAKNNLERYGLHSACLAGIWAVRAPTQLCWRVKKSHSTGKSVHWRLGDPKAPSWSWASVNGTIWMSMGMTPRATLVKHSMITDAGRHVAGSSITLRGKMVPVQLRRFNRLSDPGFERSLDGFTGKRTQYPGRESLVVRNALLQGSEAHRSVREKMVNAGEDGVGDNDEEEPGWHSLTVEEKLLLEHVAHGTACFEFDYNGPPVGFSQGRPDENSSGWPPAEHRAILLASNTSGHHAAEGYKWGFEDQRWLLVQPVTADRPPFTEVKERQTSIPSEHNRYASSFTYRSRKDVKDESSGQVKEDTGSTSEKHEGRDRILEQERMESARKCERREPQPHWLSATKGLYSRVGLLTVSNVVPDFLGHGAQTGEITLV